jgi:pheromone shutdown protein TraB
MRHKFEAEADGDNVATRRRRTMKRELLSFVAVIALVGLLMLAFKTGLVNVAATAFGQWFAGLLLNH